jgi:hypothetical protein
LKYLNNLPEQVKSINNKYASDPNSIHAIIDALKTRAAYGIYKVVIEGFVSQKE